MNQIPKGYGIGENPTEKFMVCNYGEWHYILKKGDRTPILSMTILNSFQERHPELKILTGTKEDIESIATPLMEQSFESDAEESEQIQKRKRGRPRKNEVIS